MNNNQIFLYYIDFFEKILSQFNYTKEELVNSTSKTAIEGLSVKYINFSSHTELIIGYNLSTSGVIMLNFSMFKIPYQNTIFSLYNFLDRHGLKGKLNFKMPAGGDFEPFVKKYFEDLKSLFENELNDQITGKTFENHMGALNESWNQHRDTAYQMELNEIDKFNKSKKH